MMQVVVLRQEKIDVLAHIQRANSLTLLFVLCASNTVDGVHHMGEGNLFTQSINLIVNLIYIHPHRLNKK